MKAVLTWVAVAALSLAGLAGLALGGRALGLFSFQVFAPKEEAARREVFETSKAYRDGMAQELRAMEMQYVQASDEHKAALRSIVLHRAAGVPVDAIPPDLAVWLNTLRQESPR